MGAVPDIHLATEQLERVLRSKVVEQYGEGTQIEGLVRLSGGASRETWSFDAVQPDKQRIPLILKRDPLNYQADGSFTSEGFYLGVDRLTEGRLIHLADQVGVPVPKVPFYLEANDQTTEGFITERLVGETLGVRIIREKNYAQARSKLAFQCGHAAARLHSIPLEQLTELKSMDVEEELTYYHEVMDSFGHPHAGFEYGFCWLGERLELAGNRHSFVHGDFRNGNILINEEGLQGVLDFELAHLGNPISDLGWICIPSWRFGYYSKRVGGFGEVEELLDGYEAGGGERVERETIHYWEVFGTLRWGILCMIVAFQHINGIQRSLEMAAVGRRAAETEYDLLQLVD